jgi:crotonobetainyl-CoA:carnitine CoA-transferase CaiB-like acyl-CoA transferase
MSLSAKAPLLQGVRVLDLTTVVFGPYCTQTLADLGADVIKVETAAGDAFRYSARPAKTRGMSPGYLALNRGKRSLVLDLKTPEGLAQIKTLIAGADVFVHNVREAAIERLGLGYEAVKTIKADIVYVHCVGYGSDGPYAGKPAYDDVIQAASGTTTLLSRADGNPTPRYFPSLIADKISGLHGAYAVMAACIHRLRTGEGQFVEVPMFELFTQFMLKEHLGGLTFDPPNGPAGYARQIDPDRQPFPTADGYVSFVAYSEEAWKAVFAIMGASEVMSDPDYATPQLVAANASGLYREVAKRMPARSTADWLAAFDAAEIPAMAVRDLNDILEDPHLEATDFFRRAMHPTEGAYRDMRPPVRFGAKGDFDVSPAPTLGQHPGARWRD